MEKRIQKDSWLRKIRTLVVVGVMAVVGAGSAWGQSYTIQYKNGSRQTNIPERLDTVYIPDGESRELYVPELRNNDGCYAGGDGNVDYRWYVRWYRADANGDPIAISSKFESTNVNLSGTEIIEGGTAAAANHSAALHTDTQNTSLFWYSPFFKEENYSSTATGASTILYTRSAGDMEDVVFCDVSMNTDYSPTGSLADGGTLTEPTLSKRYKFVIRPAKEIADKIKAANGAGIEHYEISAPSTAQGINIQMKTFPSNYCWYDGSSILSGDHYEYEYDGGKSGTLASDKQVIGLGSVPTQTTVNVYAVASNGQKSPLLATFTIIPQDNAAFMLEENVKTSTDPRRNPEKHDDLYEGIGSADFDMDNDILIGDLSSSNNLCPDPMGAELTTYAFFKPTTTIRAKQKYSPLQNQYGLYRSANVQGVSEDDGKAGKDYFWFFLYHDHYSADLYAYDRTYANTNGARCGYFFYTDASNEPGRLVKLKLDDVICQYTELTVTAWVNDMTTWEEKDTEGKPLPPNININFIGEKENGEEVVLHRFTSGNALTDYTGTFNEKENKGNNNVGKWQQLCYTFSISSDQTGYVDYYLEVQNNTAHTYGADYAIDDVRVYKSKPNIKVRRDNNCDASDLIIGTDYPTILRNMGWTAGDLVADIDDNGTADNDYNDIDYRKYRYGLMGSKHQFLNSTAGNVYFAFLDENKKNWQVINKQAQDIEGVNDMNPAAMSLRVAVSTVQSKEQFEFYVEMTDDTEEAEEKAKAQAQINEQIMNLRAVKDYLDDYDTYWKDEEGHTNGRIDTTGIGTPGYKNFNESRYQEAIVELFARRLKIPRLRCPWYDKGQNHLYLAMIDVNNTDLKYRGQGGASGKYWVVTFSAEEVAGTGGGTGVIDPTGTCTLMSEFTVEPATTVLIDSKSPGDPTIEVCIGTVQQITAYLNFYDKETGESRDEEMKYLDYIFDWYLGPMTEYDDITADKGFSIKTALNAYRDDTGNTSNLITTEDIDKWINQDRTNHEAMGELLKDLLNHGLLLLGTPANEPFDMPINAERMVAMPYLPTETINKIVYEFCSAETEVNLQAVADPIPVMHQGFVNVSYPEGTKVALRLGWPNMNSTTLNLPIYKVENMVSSAKYLGLDGNQPTTILLDNEELGLPPVGTVTTLHIERPEGDGKLPSTAKMTFSLNTNAKNYLKEGQEYTLLIPFVQFDESNNQLGSACNGLLRLPVKIVPEYLTWQGNTTNNKWYVDDNWTQSTKKELHEDAVDDTDAHNGSDIITDAFAPLYFTNITLLGDSVPAATYAELQLEGDKGTVDENGGALNLGKTYSIQYDLAVNTNAAGNAVITPYYINKVNNIYFKPGATLHRQDRLSYKNAWVDFEMTKGQPYWMSSPLKDVYAGDMYAPKEHGRQETEVFKDIKYVGEHEATTTDGILNDRWSPAFYQKAWDNAIEYASGDANNDGIPDKANNEIENVVAVSSNWSIEYNDVTVPYSIKTTDGATTTQKLGKGFYARVENFNNRENKALVRLPKADDDYKYETRALTDLSTDRSQSGQLADKTNFTINLETDVDGDGTHFLIGNPYMAYLNMTSFFNTENLKVLDKKYWTLVEGATEAAVGTPDVEWTGAKDAGFIAPMQAFFVEKAANVAEGTTLNVTFSPTMVATKEEAEASNTTRSYIATNPQLTLTAQSANGTSRVAVVQRTDASNQYKSDEDAVTLLDSELKAPTVYTVAGNYAAAVNVVRDCKNIPLGVYADSNEEVELTIEGASQLVSPLYLYDAVTRSTTPIEGDSYTLSLTGSSHGRYFLTTDEGIKAEGDIRIYSPADGQLIIASTPSDRLKQVQVYDLNGRMVESRQNVGTATCQLYVPGGIYIVRVQSEQGEAQAKLKIK